jgi:small subunit ribosomal protein S5
MREFRNVQKDEFKDKVLETRRVTRVVAGGKRFRFRTTVVVGDMKGRVGVGMAKSIDLQQAIQKSRNNAKKNVVKIAIHNGTIPHEVIAKFSAAKVMLKPARPGHGLMAGGAVRVVLELAGVKDATAKCLGTTTNKLSTAMATIEALKSMRPDKKIKNETSEPVVKTESNI